MYVFVPLHWYKLYSLLNLILFPTIILSSPKLMVITVICVHCIYSIDITMIIMCFFFLVSLHYPCVLYCRINSRRLATLSRPIFSDTAAPPLPSLRGNLPPSVPTSHVTRTRPSATITRGWRRSFTEKRSVRKFKPSTCLELACPRRPPANQPTSTSALRVKNKMVCHE